MKKNLFIIITGICIIADIITKIGAIVYLSGKSYLIFGGIFGLKLVKNPGIAFSIPITGLILNLLTLALIGFLGRHYYMEEKSKKSVLLDISYGLIIGGAIGNGIERLSNSRVTDFIALKYFAIFNFGDIFISVGAAMLIYSYLKNQWTKK